MAAKMTTRQRWMKCIGLFFLLMFLLILLFPPPPDRPDRRAAREVARLSRVCDSLRSTSSLTPNKYEKLTACDRWDVPAMERLLPPDWWDKTVEHLAEWFSDR